jgi:predicted glycosyltransferase
MRYLIFTNTPAHVHLYRNVVPKLQAQGHDVLVLARDYACTESLLEYFDLPYEIYGGQNPSFQSLAVNAPRQFARIHRLVSGFDPDIIVGRGEYAAFAGTTTRTSTILVLDSVPHQLGHRVSSLVADSVLTPEAYRGDLGSHHYHFDGLKECAYLHPDVFTPDASVREELGVDADEEYVIVRCNAYDALHDVGATGFSVAQQRRLIRTLAEHATVFVSDEGGNLDFDDLPARPYDIHPARIHDALAEAELLVTDTGTMATEAALVATPAVRVVDESEPSMGEFDELERNDLLYQMTDFEAVAETTAEMLRDEDVADVWQQRRDAYLESKPNLTNLLVEVARQPTRVDRVSEQSPHLQPR